MLNEIEQNVAGVTASLTAAWWQYTTEDVWS